MKNLITSIILIFCTVSFTSAQFMAISISGHVTNLNGGSPVTNHLVYIHADSSLNPAFGYYSTVTTDLNGYYDDTVLVPIDSTIIFNIFTFDCVNNMHQAVVVSTNPPFIADFLICDSGIANCNALFSFNPDPIDPFIYHFIDLSTGNPDLWLWDFGDGTFSTLQNPTHTYSTTGPFQVCLTITNNDSLNFCTSTYCDLIITDSIIICFANFQANSAPSNPLAYHFINQSSPNIDHWLWDFGDGTSSGDQNPFHTYPDTGLYYVCLTVASGMPGTGLYCEDTYCDSVYINVFAPACFADFDIMTNSIDPFSLTFINLSVGNFNEVRWDFGDGSFSQSYSPVHTYSGTGNYNVCLTVYHINAINADTLCSDTYCKQISIPPPNFHNLAGQVFASFFPDTLCNIYLYKHMNNGDILLFDTTSIDTNGVYYFYQIPAGNYLVKVAPEKSNPFFGQTLPTYFGDVIHWIDADEIQLNNDFYGADIHLQPYQFFGGGPGTIIGKISFEGGKFDEKGPPASDVEVLLFDMQHNPLQLDYTTSNGFFEFDNLPIGTYQVYPEITGKNTVPLTVTIFVHHTMIKNIDFIITPGAVMISLDENLPDNIESISDIYPNPTVDRAYIDLDLSRTSKIEFRIHNHIGQIININEHMLQTGENRVTFNTSDLANGIYMLQIVNDNESIIMKKFIKTD